MSQNSISTYLGAYINLNLSSPTGELYTFVASSFGPYKTSFNFLFLGGWRTDTNTGLLLGNIKLSYQIKNHILYCIWQSPPASVAQVDAGAEWEPKRCEIRTANPDAKDGFTGVPAVKYRGPL